ncbi:unnamed protein product, partial [Ectocarpus fasciculatus]
MTPSPATPETSSSTSSLSTGSVHIRGHDRGWRKEAQVRQGYGGHGSFGGSPPSSRPEGHASPYELQLLEP